MANLSASAVLLDWMFHRHVGRCGFWVIFSLVLIILSLIWAIIVWALHMRNELDLRYFHKYMDHFFHYCFHRTLNLRNLPFLFNHTVWFRNSLKQWGTKMIHDRTIVGAYLERHYNVEMKFHVHYLEVYIYMWLNFLHF